MNLTEMLGSLGLIGMGVIGCLLVLSLYSVAVIFEKFRRFREASRESEVFLAEFGSCLDKGKLQEAFSTARRYGRSHVARVVSAGFNELAAPRPPATAQAATVEHVSRALDRSTVLTLSEMKKGLGALATIGSTAPFIGLFGTVVGIIHAFQGISESGGGGLAAVSGGIAEALVATAFGIFVALPAVMAFNYFTGALERFQVEMSTTAARLVDYLSKRQGAAHASA